MTPLRGDELHRRSQDLESLNPRDEQEDDTDELGEDDAGPATVTVTEELIQSLEELQTPTREKSHGKAAVAAGKVAKIFSSDERSQVSIVGYVSAKYRPGVWRGPTKLGSVANLDGHAGLGA